MAVSQRQPRVSGRSAGDRRATVVTAGVGLLAAYHLALAAFMAAAPHAFFAEVGPFGVFNDHYIRDLASYNAALGLALAWAAGHPTWRVPLLAATLIQFFLHSANHLLDVDAAHPAWTGYFDFASLAAATLALAWLLRAAHAERATLHLDDPHPKGDPR